MPPAPEVELTKLEFFYFWMFHGVKQHSHGLERLCQTVEQIKSCGFELKTRRLLFKRRRVLCGKLKFYVRRVSAISFLCVRA